MLYINYYNMKKYTFEFMVVSKSKTITGTQDVSALTYWLAYMSLRGQLKKDHAHLGKGVNVIIKRHENEV